jgi:hypothetical protein
MARSLKPEQQEEFDRLYREISIIISFLHQEGQLTNRLAMRYRETLEQVKLRNDLRGMRIMRRDDNEAIRDLSPADQQRLKAILAKEVGTDLDAERRAELALIDQVVKRGQISTEEEYRLVLGRVEEIYDKPDADDEVKRLNELLRAFANSPR